MVFFSYLPGASLDVTNHAEPEASHAEPETSPSEAESQSGSDSELAMEEDSVQNYIICKLICCINCTKLAFISGIVAVYNLAMFIASEQQLEAFCG